MAYIISGLVSLSCLVVYGVGTLLALRLVKAPTGWLSLLPGAGLFRTGGQPLPRTHQLLAAFAGPAFLYLVIVCATLTLHLSAGRATGQHSYIVAATSPGFDAHGKLQAGDRIVAVGGRAVTFPATPLAPLITELAHRRPEIDVVVVRDGEARTLAVVARSDSEQERYRIGIMLRTTAIRARPGVGSAVAGAVTAPAAYARQFATTTYRILVDDHSGHVRGPVGITEMQRDTRSRNWIEALRSYGGTVMDSWLFLSLVSIGLAIAAIARRRHPRNRRKTD